MFENMKNFIYLALLGLTACGTIFSGTSQKMTFDANVSDVDIYIDGFKTCKTPCTTEIPRENHRLLISARKEGYQEEILSVRPGFNAVAVFNTTALTSWTTDFVAGGIWEYKRDKFYVEMKKNNQGKIGRQNKRNLEIKHFALFNYDEIVNEAYSHQAGEYITSLAKLANLSRAEIVELAMTYSDEVNFAEAVVEKAK